MRESGARGSWLHGFITRNNQAIGHWVAAAKGRLIDVWLELVQRDGNDSGDAWAGSVHSPIVGNWLGMSETMCTHSLPRANKKT